MRERDVKLPVYSDVDNTLGRCDVHYNCLECPLSACKYDDDSVYRKWQREQRKPKGSGLPMQIEQAADNGDAIPLWFYDGEAIIVIANREGLNRLSLYRMIREGKVDLRTHKQLMQDTTRLGLSRCQVRNMIDKGLIQRKSPDQFPPIKFPVNRAYRRKIAA
jgi:hypothetical protein